MEPDQLFKALADPTRLRCLALLIAGEELCVCELTEVLALPQPKVSHHLAALRRLGLVTDRKAGLWVHYRINEALPEWVSTILHTAASGVTRMQPYAEDRTALEQLREIPSRQCSN